MDKNNFKLDNIDIYKSSLISKEATFKHIAEFISSKINISAQIILEGLHQRERESSTYIGEGVAIPHVILQEAQTAHVFLHLPQNKVDYQSYDLKLVDIIFTLVIPKDKYNKEHLKQISLLATHLLDETFQKFLREEKDKVKLFEKINKIQEEL